MRKTPAPNAYNPEKPFKVLNVPLQTGPKCLITAESEQRAAATPGFKYDVTRADKLVRKKVLAPNMNISKSARELNYKRDKIRKSKDPDGGSYEVMRSFLNTQTMRYKGRISQSKLKSFTEFASYLNRHSPGPGSYFIPEKKQKY